MSYAWSLRAGLLRMDCKRLVGALFFVCLMEAVGKPSVDISFYVRSQDLSFHKAAIDEITASVTEAGFPHTSVVHMADAEKEYRHQGLWSYLPWIWHSERQRSSQGKRRTVGGGQRWLVFLEPATAVDAAVLAQVLETYDAKELWYLGHALTDTEMSIVHHYQTDPAYPLAHAGFALSAGLLRKMMLDFEEKPIGGGQQIEPVWELANRLKKMDIRMTDRKDAFCIVQGSSCGTWVTGVDRHRRSLGLTPENVFIAVKTVKKFHEVRIPVLQEFWAAESPVEVQYLSNEADDSVQGAKIVDLSAEFGDMVDPSKESTSQGSGHCTKMVAILRHLRRHQPGRSWYVITDDDTLLDVRRLLQVLDSHDPQEAIYMGERYGWSHMLEHAGTNYITTGAGMALSAPALEKIVMCSHCTCRSPNAPDDMSLGSWFKSLGVKVTHEEGFRQSEPNNYHEDLLKVSDKPISFHRFNARLPGSSSKEEFAKARRANWGSWVKKYFTHGSQRQEL